MMGLRSAERNHGRRREHAASWMARDGRSCLIEYALEKVPGGFYNLAGQVLVRSYPCSLAWHVLLDERDVLCTFDTDVLKAFLCTHDLDLLCRAHQVVEDGYEFLRQWPSCCDDGGEEYGASFRGPQRTPRESSGGEVLPCRASRSGPNRSGAWRGRGRGPDLPGYLNPR
jgi:hypothetical protein